MTKIANHGRGPGYGAEPDAVIGGQRRFLLFDETMELIGYGFAYAEGNVQVQIQSRDYAKEQMQLADVLNLENVEWFQWQHEGRLDIHKPKP